MCDAPYVLWRLLSTRRMSPNTLSRLWMYIQLSKSRSTASVDWDFHSRAPLVKDEAEIRLGKAEKIGVKEAVRTSVK